MAAKLMPDDAFQLDTFNCRGRSAWMSTLCQAIFAFQESPGDSWGQDREPTQAGRPAQFSVSLPAGWKTGEVEVQAKRLPEPTSLSVEFWHLLGFGPDPGLEERCKRLPQGYHRSRQDGHGGPRVMLGSMVPFCLSLDLTRSVLYPAFLVLPVPVACSGAGSVLICSVMNNTDAFGDHISDQIGFFLMLRRQAQDQAV